MNATYHKAKALLHARWAEEERELQEAQRQALAEAEAEQRKQAEAAERDRLEALRGERLIFEEIESMTPEQRAHFDQHADPRKWVKEIFQQARQQEEEEYAAELTAEKERRLKDWAQQRGRTAPGQRTQILKEVEQEIKEKADAWLKARELRELKAEEQPDEIRRLAYSLGERGQKIMSELIDTRPDTITLIQQSRQAVQASQRETLKSQYVAEMKSNMRGGVIPRHIAMGIQEKYQGMGLDTGANDVVSEVTNLRRT